MDWLARVRDNNNDDNLYHHDDRSVVDDFYNNDTLDDHDPSLVVRRSTPAFVGGFEEGLGACEFPVSSWAGE